MKNRIAFALALCSLLYSFAGESQSHQLPPEGLSQTEIKEMKEEIAKYLAKKAGQAPPLQPPKADVAEWSRAQFAAAEKAKNTKLLYQLIHSHLPLAERLMQSKDEKVRREGLLIVMRATYCAIDTLQDKWLAPGLAETYLMPNRELAHESRGRTPNVAEVLVDVAYVYQQLGDTEKYLEVYLQLLSTGGGGPNAGEVARVRIAIALDKLGRYQEAIRCLEEIDPKGSLAGSRADLLKDVRKKLDAQRAKIK